MKYYGVRSKIIYTPTPIRFFNICCGKIGKKIWRLHRQNTLPYPCTPPYPLTVSHWIGCTETAAKYPFLTVWFSVTEVWEIFDYSCKTFVLHCISVSLWHCKVDFAIMLKFVQKSRNSLNINHLHTTHSNSTYQFRNYTTKTYHKIRNNIPKSVNRH